MEVEGPRCPPSLDLTATHGSHVFIAERGLTTPAIMSVTPEDDLGLSAERASVVKGGLVKRMQTDLPTVKESTCAVSKTQLIAAIVYDISGISIEWIKTTLFT